MADPRHVLCQLKRAEGWLLYLHVDNLCSHCWVCDQHQFIAKGTPFEEQAQLQHAEFCPFHPLNDAKIVFVDGIPT